MSQDMNEVNGLITFLSSSLGLTFIGLAYQHYRNKRMERDATDREINSYQDTRLTVLEKKIIEMDKSDTRLEGSLKRFHQRMDDMEKSHDKLENKIEKDLQEVKKSIADLTTLVIKAISKGE